MLLELTQYLEQFDSGFGVFQYLTFRAILGVLTALATSLIIGPFMIRWLIRYQVGQTVRDDGPQSHLDKAGTPTMGGALILVAIALATLCWSDLSNRFVWIVLLTTLAFGAIGWWDDYRKLVMKDPKGLAPRLVFVSVRRGNGVCHRTLRNQESPAETQLLIPFFKDAAVELGIGFIFFSYFVIVGTSNAVNLTDGLDGLMIMPTVLVAGALGVFTYVVGHANFAAYLGFPLVPGAGGVVFCGAIVGAGLGFLWFNTYPAQVFMGDVGALALGAALGVIAIVARQELVLVVMGGVFVMETVCDLAGGEFQTNRKRIFGWRRCIITLS